VKNQQDHDDRFTVVVSETMAVTDQIPVKQIELENAKGVENV
jgi:hypothetical protein